MMALAGALCLGCTSDTDEVTDENGDTSGEVITEPSDDDLVENAGHSVRWLVLFIRAPPPA